ncbi:MAG TPA: cytochrome b [Burkholderiales bacterium]|jgi:cytochrome b561|nr:cytochrome b [Burkholderiales bacterium]
MSENAQRYSTLAIALHWITAVLVLTLIGLGLYMTDIPRGTPERSFFYNLHKSIGLTTGLVVLLRLWWRYRNPPPPLPPSVPGWQVRASRISHALLYLCLIVMPLAGFSASQFTKFGVTYFGLFKIPPLGPENKEIYDFLQGIHGTTAVLLMALIVVHVVAALKHLLVDKDGVFQRMLPGR